MFMVDCIIELVLNIFIGKEKRCKDLLGKTFRFVNGNPFAENGMWLEKIIDVKYGYVKYEYTNVNSNSSWTSSTECDTFLLCLRYNKGKQVE